MKKIIKLGVLVYLGFGAFIFMTHRSMVYYPNLIKSDFYNCPAFDDSEKINANGTRGYYKHTSDKIVVVYHGNAGSACDRSYLKNIFNDAGYSYLFMEYAGYGGNDKKPTRELLFKDAENITAFLKTKNYAQTVLFAESIGSGIASYHASLVAVDKILFITPFDSLVNVAITKFPIYPMFLLGKFSKENYDNVNILRDYKKDLMIIHGAKDKIIPFKHGKTLFESINTSNKKLITIEEAGHNNIYNSEKTWEAVSSFLKSE